MHFYRVTLKTVGLCMASLPIDSYAYATQLFSCEQIIANYVAIYVATITSYILCCMYSYFILSVRLSN